MKEKNWGGRRAGAGRKPKRRATIEIGETVGVVERSPAGRTMITLYRLVSVTGAGRDNKVITLEPVST